LACHHQHGDQGRELVRVRVAAHHSEQRFGGRLIVVSGLGYHSPFSI